MHDFSARLLDWFAHNGRSLPWRGTRDAYAIWLSEVILQQTQVSQGRDYWTRFVTRWPTVGDLAQASEDEVLRMWQGLGYYSRARHLHQAARQVVAMGGFPTTVEGLRGLKGVGPYTAAAVASMAFGVSAAVVDGNVYRVLARHFGISTPINSAEGQHEFQSLARLLLPEGRAADFNQAIMDFGATQCVPRSPQCAACPVMLSCVAFREGRVGQLPVKLKTTKVKQRHLAYVYMRCNGQTALRRRGAGDIWQGLWEPVLVERGARSEERGGLSVELGERMELRDGCGKVVDGVLTLLRSGVKHILTHRVLTADFYLFETEVRPELPPGYQWIDEERRDDYAVPRLVELLFEALP